MFLKHLVISTFVICIFFTKVQVQAFTGYVTNIFESNVSVFDSTTNTVIATITAGAFPRPIAITPDREKAYIGNIIGNTVTILDLFRNIPIGTITVGTAPQDVAIAQNGRAYVTISDDTLAVIETSSDLVIATITLGSALNPFGNTVAPMSNKVYVVNLIGMTVSEVSTLTNIIIATITVGNSPNFIAITKDESRGYVTNSGDDNVTIVNLNSRLMIGTITVGEGPIGLALTPNDAKLYVANFMVDAVSVINTSSNILIATVTAGNGAQFLAITPDGTWVYVSNGYGNNLSVIDTTFDNVIATITVGMNPGEITFASALPVSVRAEVKKNIFLTQKELFNVIEWKRAEGIITEYRIYRDEALTDLIAIKQVSDPRIFRDHNRAQNTTYTYVVVAMNGSAVVSQGKVTVTTGR